MTPLFSIAQQDVHLWRCDLRSLASLDVGLLSKDEEERAKAFVFERDRTRYQRGRALLRLLLSRYLGVEPEGVSIPARAHIKPRLEQGDIYFNVSHSQDNYVLAVARFEIGVDVEISRTVEDALQLGRNVFSPEENAQLQASPSISRDHSFLLGWTRKEAFVKALGIGLGGVDLTAITVGLDPSPKTVPALPGISAIPVEVRSHQLADEYIASASSYPFAKVSIRDVDAQVLKALGV